MTENDYIAEYIREKRPELITSLDFVFWKIGRITTDAFKGFAEALRNIQIPSAATEAEHAEETTEKHEEEKNGGKL